MLYPAILGPSQNKFYQLLVFSHQLILIPTFGKLLVIIAKAFNILPCSSSLDVKNQCTPCNRPAHYCRVGYCPAEAWRHGTASGSDGEYNTDEDSGCVGSCSTLNTGCRRCSSRNTQRTFCNSCQTSCRRPCPYRSCLKDHKELNWCCNSHSIHTQSIVNGEMIDEVKMDEVPCKKWAKDTSCNVHGKSPSSGTGKNTLCRSFLLSDSHNSSPERSVDKTIHPADLETSRNSYAKSH